MTGEHKLSIREKVAYGLGDTASNLYWKLFEYFQLYFYTDVFGIAPASAGIMFLVTKAFDAVSDPIVGIVADRTRTAWGRFRPYLIWMAVPFALTGMLTFYTPDLSPTGKLVYAYVTYVAVFAAYTAINIPYGALMGVMSPDPVERTSLSSYRFVLAFVGGIIVQLCTEPLVAWFGGTETTVVDGIQTITVINKQAGFFWTVACYAVVAMVLFAITFLNTRERVAPVEGSSTTLKTDLADLSRNGPWLTMFAFGLAQLIALSTRGSATAFYFTYYVGIPFGSFLVAGSVASIIGMLSAKPLVQVLGRKWLLIGSSTLVAFCTAALWFVSPEQIALMYVLQIFASLVSGPIPVLAFAMYADVADYSEWKTNRRATGLVFAAATLSHKLGGAVGSAIPALCLAYFGFLQPVEGVRQIQTDFTLWGIVAMMSIIPAFFFIVSAVVLLFYQLDGPFLDRIELDLAVRKSSVRPSHH